MDIKSNKANEINIPYNTENKLYDPDKRIDAEHKRDTPNSPGYNVDKRVETSDIPNMAIGGSYQEVKKNADSETQEVHHMPADSASYLDRSDGPAISMEKKDHRQTASCGNSKEAREYRDIQKTLIDGGEFKEAIQMDIDDIQEKFSSKYDKAISEMLNYCNKLVTEGKIHE